MLSWVVDINSKKKISLHTLMEWLENLIDLSGNWTHDPRISTHMLKLPWQLSR